MIKEFSTPITNEILTEVFAKGLLNQTEMRIVSYIIRWSWGFHREWTNESTVQKIADDIGISRCICSRAINRMIREKKIKRDNGQYKFNENYKEWEVLTNRNTMEDKKVLTNCNGERELIATVACTNCNGEQSNNTQQINALEIPKETKERYIKDKERNIKERKIYINFNNQTFKFENIPKEKLNKWTEAFNLNVEQEVKKMEAWLTANPNKRKKNYEKFIVNWLARGGKNGKSKRSISRYVPISTGNNREKGIEANAGEW